MAMREVDPIGQAIIATEREIAGEAWGTEEPVLDETGDRTNEEMGEGLEGQHEPDDDDEAAEGDEAEGAEESETEEGEAEAQAEGETEAAAQAGDKGKPTEPEGRVPPGRLREQTERARAAEERAAKLEADLAAVQTKSQQEIVALNAKFDQAMALLTRQAPPARVAEEPKPVVVPDFFEDPAAFIAHQIKPVLDTVSQLQNAIPAQRLETSMAIAHGKHGDTFAKAYEAVNQLNPQNPEDRATVRRIYDSPNPGEALIAWHKRNETLREVGDDPAKYRERIEAQAREKLMNDPEFRKTLLEGLRAEASTGENGQPRTVTRLPKSLNGAVGGNLRVAAEVDQFDGSDQGIAEAAWR
jgi:hypothetical protein